jgi:uncharacterized protein YqjF (DUF2071 family)
MSQWWRDISFVHWRIDPGRVAPLLPPGVRPDVFDGSSWVGLIPFRMVGAGIGQGGAVPWLGTFLEMNVRLYSVDDARRHGVVFLSLEAQRLAVVLGANLTFNVPYKWATMSYGARGDRVRYTSTRLTPAGPSSRLEVRVDPAPRRASPLDLFLTARFGLHTRVAGRTLWVPNTHGPWPLQRARLVALDDALVAAAGLPGVTESVPDSVLFSTGVQTVFGLPQPV